jgi:hypothetical protein
MASRPAAELQGVLHSVGKASPRCSCSQPACTFAYLPVGTRVYCQLPQMRGPSPAAPGSCCMGCAPGMEPPTAVALTAAACRAAWAASARLANNPNVVTVSLLSVACNKANCTEFKVQRQCQQRQQMQVGQGCSRRGFAPCGAR